MNKEKLKEKIINGDLSLDKLIDAYYDLVNDNKELSITNSYLEYENNLLRLKQIK